MKYSKRTSLLTLLLVSSCTFSAQKSVKNFERFKELPRDVKSEILMQRALDEIKNAQTLQSALTNILNLRVNRETRGIINSPHFILSIMPALLQLLKNEGSVQEGLQLFTSLLNQPIIKDSLEERARDLSKLTKTPYTTLDALLSDKASYESFLNSFIDLTLEKELIPKEEKVALFGLRNRILDLVKKYPAYIPLLSDKQYIDTLFNKQFLDKFLAPTEEELNQTLLVVAARAPGTYKLTSHLISLGAKPDIQNIPISPTPLLLALSFTPQDYEKIKLLLEHSSTLGITQPTNLHVKKAKASIKQDPELKRIIEEYAKEEIKSILLNNKN